MDTKTIQIAVLLLILLVATLYLFAWGQQKSGAVQGGTLNLPPRLTNDSGLNQSISDLQALGGP